MPRPASASAQAEIAAAVAACDEADAGRAGAGARAHREPPPAPAAARRALHRRARRRARLALDGGRVGRPLRARRARQLSELGADERRAGPGRRRAAHRHGRAVAAAARSTRWCWRPRTSPASPRSTASAARRPSPRSPTAPRRCAPVAKIVGPGNAYVAAAKRQVFGTVGIDSIAGPSEVLVIADKDNDPEWMAADLLAQAEHDTAAQAILMTDDAAFAERVEAAVARQLAGLPRGNIAGASWETFGAVIVLRSLDEAPALADRIAAEHLEIATARPGGAGRAHPQRRRHLPRRAHAGGDRRLRGGLQPRAADRAQRPLLLRPRRARLHEAHLDPASSTSARSQQLGAGRHDARRAPKGSRRIAAPSPSACPARPQGMRGAHVRAPGVRPQLQVAAHRHHARRGLDPARQHQHRARARGGDLRHPGGQQLRARGPRRRPLHARSVDRRGPAGVRGRPGGRRRHLHRRALADAAAAHHEGLLHGLRDLLPGDPHRAALAHPVDRHGPPRAARRGQPRAGRAAQGQDHASTTTPRGGCSR